MGKETTIISQAKPSQAKPSQAKPWAKCALFSLSIQELCCYISQSRYSCVKWIYVYCKKAFFLLPVIGADVAGG